MFFQDVRYALRNLWLNRGFAAVGIFCLALGIGINTMIFSVVDGVLIQPFPYADPENIVAVGSRNDRLNLDFGSVSFLDLRDWRDHVTMLTGLSGSSGRSLTLSDGVGDPERFQGAAVS